MIEHKPSRRRFLRRSAEIGMGVATSALVPQMFLPAQVEAAEQRVKVLEWNEGGVDPFEGGPHDAVDFLTLLTYEEKREAHGAVDQWYAQSSAGRDTNHPMVNLVRDGDEWNEMGNGRRRKRQRHQHVIARPSKWHPDRPRQYFMIRMETPWLLDDTGRPMILETAIPVVCGNPIARRRKKGSRVCIPLPEEDKQNALPMTEWYKHHSV